MTLVMIYSMFFKTLIETFFHAVLYKFNYFWCKNYQFTVKCFPFPWDSISFSLFIDCIPRNTHRFCDMTLTFASKETSTNFIVILHCDNYLIFLRIIRLLFKVLFKWLTFKSAIRIKMGQSKSIIYSFHKVSKFSASLTLLLYCCFTYVNSLTFSI